MNVILSKSSVPFHCLKKIYVSKLFCHCFLPLPNQLHFIFIVIFQNGTVIRLVTYMNGLLLFLLLQTVKITLKITH